MPALLTPPVEDATRRQLLRGAGALTTGWILAGCGDGADSGAASLSETRSFTNETGEMEIPMRPRRVVTLDPQALEAAVAVGAPVVGSTIRDPAEPFSQTLAGRTDGIEPVGVGEPDPERVAALEPDLIIAQAFAIEAIADQLRQTRLLVGCGLPVLPRTRRCRGRPAATPARAVAGPAALHRATVGAGSAATDARIRGPRRRGGGRPLGGRRSTR